MKNFTPEQHERAARETGAARDVIMPPNLLDQLKLAVEAEKTLGTQRA